MTPSLKYNALNDELVEFFLRQRTGYDDPLLEALRQETVQKFPGDAEMQVSEVQGSLLGILTSLLNVHQALEIGTFTGHSSICIARALPADGRLTCMDMNETWTNVARQYWESADVAAKVNLILGDALESLSNLPADSEFDLVHIDAEKTLYDAFFEAAFPFIRPNGLIVFDNMLWAGRVVEEDQDERTRAIVALNEKLANDERVETVLLPVGDGIQFCRKR